MNAKLHQNRTKKEVFKKINLSLFVFPVRPPRRSEGRIRARQKYMVPTLLQQVPEPAFAKQMSLSEPNSEAKQTPDVGAVRQSGQNDNNSSSSETISNWTGSALLPFQTPACQRGKLGGCHSQTLWSGWRIIIFLGCFHAQSEELMGSVVIKGPKEESPQKSHRTAHLKATPLQPDQPELDIFKTNHKISADTLKMTLILIKYFMWCLFSTLFETLHMIYYVT